jgi:hypothetical protein
MRKTNKKNKAVQKATQSTLQRKKLKDSILEKQYVINALAQKLRALQHEIDMQKLVLATHVKDERELQSRLDTINKRAADITMRKTLIKQAENDNDIANQIRKTYTESMKQSIDNTRKHRENDDD